MWYMYAYIIFPVFLWPYVILAAGGTLWGIYPDSLLRWYHCSIIWPVFGLTTTLYFMSLHNPTSLIFGAALAAWIQWSTCTVRGYSTVFGGHATSTGHPTSREYWSWRCSRRKITLIFLRWRIVLDGTMKMGNDDRKQWLCKQNSV